MSKLNKKKIKSPKNSVPFFKPQLLEEDKKAILKSLNSSMLTNGPVVNEFEKKFAKFTKSKYAVAVSNATSALHLSLMSLDIGKGDEVIMPDLTFIATANSVLMTGATPVLADVTPDTFQISIDSIKKSITKKTKAILPVHLYGKSCDMNSIQKIAKKNNLKIIEDCAHAIGTKYKNKHVGTFGDTGCFSFYPSKNITTFEGGMIITNSKKLDENLRMGRNHGINRTLKDRYSSKYPWEYDIKQYGYNYRLDEIRSTLGINQLKRINKINNSRRDAFKYYCKKLSNIDGILLPSQDNLKEHACHLFVISIDKSKFGLDRNRIHEKLLKKGIYTSIHYKPLHLFTLFKKKSKIYDDLINSSKLYDQIISLPFYTSMPKNEQNIIVNEIKNLSLN
jgi:dTDP-4-amino-4,6-dideoxygalactose transaminase